MFVCMYVCACVCVCVDVCVMCACVHPHACCVCVYACVHAQQTFKPNITLELIYRSRGGGGLSLYNCQGDGLAQWLERWPGDPKVEGLNPVGCTRKTLS